MAFVGQWVEGGYAKRGTKCGSRAEQDATCPYAGVQSLATRSFLEAYIVVSILFEIIPI